MSNAHIDVCNRKLTVLELAALIGIHRGQRLGSAAALGDRLGVLFECPVPGRDFERVVARFTTNGFAAAGEAGLAATRAGRAAARPLLTGLIGMLDQGTKLLDVALLTTLLRLAKGELDDDR